MSPLRAGLRVALNRPQVLGVVAVAFTLEGLLRAALAVLYPPLALLCPPVVAVCLLGRAAPATRAAVESPDADPDWRLETFRDRPYRRLAGAAAAGHALALLLGTSAFLVVDTAARAAVYALDGTVPVPAVIVLPFTGVAIGTLVAWALLVPGLARVAAGASLSAGARTSLYALARRRRTTGTLLLHGGCALVGAAVFFTGIAYTLTAVSQLPSHPVRALAFTTGLSTVAAVALGAITYPVSVAMADRPTTVETVPVKRIVLAALVLSGFVVGASAVRLTETRPMHDTAPAAGDLPKNATAAYTEAIKRTNAVDSRVVAKSGEAFRTVTIVEDDARRYRVEVHDEDGTSVAYVDSGVDYSVGSDWTLFALDRRTVDGRSVLSTPGYWRVADHDVSEPGLGYSLPQPEASEWRQVERANGTLTVELTGGEAVFRALGYMVPENLSTETAWVRMAIDTEAGVVTGGELRLNATTEHHTFDRRAQFDVETGESVHAERPDSLGSPSLGEWLWRLFAY